MTNLNEILGHVKNFHTQISTKCPYLSKTAQRSRLQKFKNTKSKLLFVMNKLNINIGIEHDFKSY